MGVAVRGLACAFAAAGALLAAEPPVRVRIVAALVGPDLAVKPVPRAPLEICDEPDCAEPVLCSTTFEGEAVVLLPPGRYRVESREPVTYRGRTYRWSVPLEVEPGAPPVLELSCDNAVTADLPPEQAANEPAIETRLYERARAGVFRVDAESASGSGFLADSSGLVLTNHHVVRDSSYLAVRLAPDRKVRAVRVADDPGHDLAVLRVHPAALDGRRALELAWDEPERPPVRVGDRVVALGDPFTTEAAFTAGVVSRIEASALLSDAALKPGNSGGPLLRADGAVVAVNTFGSQDRVGAMIGGSIRAWRARALLDRARTAAGAADPPPADLLPVDPPGVPFDTLLAAARARPPDPGDYDARTGSLRVRVLTPLLAAIAAAGPRSRPADPDEPLPELGLLERRAGEQIRPVATVVVVPREGGGLARLELQRDGIPVPPIHPGRYGQGEGRAWLAYEYPPGAFAPGAALRLLVWDDGARQPRVKPLAADMQQRVWDDFGVYREAGP